MRGGFPNSLGTFAHVEVRFGLVWCERGPISGHIGLPVAQLALFLILLPLHSQHGFCLIVSTPTDGNS